MHGLKVVKIDSKIIYLLHYSKTMTHSVGLAPEQILKHLSLLSFSAATAASHTTTNTISVGIYLA